MAMSNSTPSRVLADLRAGNPVSMRRAVFACVICAHLVESSANDYPTLARMYADKAQRIAELWSRNRAN
jgi:hypothetical protein